MPWKPLFIRLPGHRKRLLFEIAGYMLFKTYSTVTLFAKFLGLSTSVPLSKAA